MKINKLISLLMFAAAFAATVSCDKDKEEEACCKIGEAIDCNLRCRVILCNEQMHQVLREKSECDYRNE